MDIQCRCGQGFHIQAERYPHRIACHACGRHFNVWSDGSVIDLGEPTAASTFEASAIQATPMLSLAPADARSTDIAAGGFPTDPMQTAAAKLRAELRVIDLQWEKDRELHWLFPAIGITIMPTRKLSGAVAFTFLLICASLLVTMIMVTTRNPDFICPGWFGLAIFFYPSLHMPFHIFRMSQKYEKARAAWQGKRALAIGKSGLPEKCN